ncbi:hypothetical protein [Phenylobacterium sp.]|uniref:tetratricopeptide repeat protein n=1 Tax=Phenylobacterium sp. TaxID=1871053 RepID=UPI002F9488F7
MTATFHHWGWPTKAAEPEPQGDPMLRLGRELMAEGRPDRALTIFEHMHAQRPLDPEPLSDVVAALAAGGRTLEVLHRLADLQSLHGGPAPVADQIREHGTAAIAKFNAAISAQKIEEAAQYAEALARLMPTASGVVAAALSCNQALGRTDEAQRYARALVALEPGNVAAHTALCDLAKAAGDAEGEIRHRMAIALAERADVVPLIRLRDIHDVASMILCRPLTPDSEAQLGALLKAGLALDIPAPEGSEWAAWAKHYGVLLQAIDLDAIAAATPAAGPEPELAFLSSKGRAMDWKAVQARARKLGAQAVFFAAADAHYVELYARWYVLSLLKFCDVPFMVVVHVIGGAASLKAAAKTVGIQDDRLVFCGDSFDASAVATKAYDAPPKGQAEKPIAHFQCVRFQRLGELLTRLERPVFVSDIDLLLQRGVADLLDRHAAADLVLNENELSWNAGSRITANLLLLKPTGNAQAFLRFLRAYLDDKLGRPEVTRWIDQVALVHARHHLVRHGLDPQIGYFDTATDINNVMYPSFQAHPFRFLSLYHGFDTSSLEDPRVLG